MRFWVCFRFQLENWKAGMPSFHLMHNAHFWPSLPFFTFSRSAHLFRSWGSSGMKRCFSQESWTVVKSVKVCFSKESLSCIELQTEPAISRFFSFLLIVESASRYRSIFTPFIEDVFVRRNKNYGNYYNIIQGEGGGKRERRRKKTLRKGIKNLRSFCIRNSRRSMCWHVRCKCNADMVNTERSSTVGEVRQLQHHK